MRKILSRSITAGIGKLDMAKIAFQGGDEFGERLNKLCNTDTRGIVTRAVAKGAGIVADAIRVAIDALPTQKAIHLQKGAKLTAVQEHEMEDIKASFGITPVKTDKNGFTHAKVGFDGYGSKPTKKYPKGVPNQLVAASIERGSSVRQKHPFVRPAVNKTRAEAINAMDESIDADIQAIFRNN